MDEASTSSKEQAVDSSELAAKETVSPSSSSAAAAPSWRPSQRVFGPYLPAVQTNAKPQTLRVVVRRPVSALFQYYSRLFLVCLLYLLYSLLIWDFLDWG
ncbi:hypothetical protein HAX54_046827 [Datura stramonium]|uniref:Uncharacterized protein n=1 Tax=Datura stramonium TaxID=4076 RepID=A0ABS8SS06_DATST|nr:hypothetical protein [Datura stramonium]